MKKKRSELEKDIAWLMCDMDLSLYLGKRPSFNPFYGKWARKTIKKLRLF